MNVIQYQDDVPVYELTGDEIVFPLVLGDREFYVHCKPYQSRDLKEVFRNVVSKAKNEGGGLKVVPASTDKCYPLFWKTFKELSGVTHPDGTPLTEEEQRKFIESKPRLGIPVKIVLSGFGGHRTSLEVQDIFEDDVKVRTTLYAHCPETSRTEKLEIFHNTVQETEEHTRIYNQAVGQRKVTREGEWSRSQNVDSLELLYNSLAESLEGAVINGQSCTKENKKEWIGLVPLWWKTMALDELFTGVEVKNA